MHPLRSTIHLIAAAMLCAAALTGCNSGVFVNNFAPESVDIHLEGSGDKQAVKFSSSKWSNLALSTLSIERFHFTVTPKGGEPQEGSRLRGNGNITAENLLTRMTVTRYESTVTIDVDYSVGAGRPLEFYLTAADEGFSQVYAIKLTVESDSAALRLDRVDYGALNTWGTEGEPQWVKMPGGIINASDREIVYDWSPDSVRLPLTAETVTEYGLVLSALRGERIPIPTWDPSTLSWQLTGLSAQLPGSDAGSYVLTSFPALEPITVEPKTRCEVWMLTETTVFTPTMSVENTIADQRYEMLTWVKMATPMRGDSIYRVVKEAL